LNPSILHFSRTGSILKMLFFLGLAAIALAVASLMHAEREAPPQSLHLSGVELPAPGPRRDPLAPFKIPLLIVAGGVCLFYAGRHGLRAVTREVAARTEGGRLYLHSSYGAEADPLPIEAIIDAIFDRADRLPGDASGSANLGARLRHGLYLRYRAGGATRELRLIDNDIDGGTEQLRRFAAHLDAWRQSRRTPDAAAG
jgi:hypothetical protein